MTLISEIDVSQHWTERQRAVSIIELIQKKQFFDDLLNDLGNVTNRGMADFFYHFDNADVNLDGFTSQDLNEALDQMLENSDHTRLTDAETVTNIFFNEEDSGFFTIEEQVIKMLTRTYLLNSLRQNFVWAKISSAKS